MGAVASLLRCTVPESTVATTLSLKLLSVTVKVPLVVRPALDSLKLAVWLSAPASEMTGALFLPARVIVTSCVALLAPSMTEILKMAVTFCPEPKKSRSAWLML